MADLSDLYCDKARIIREKMSDGREREARADAIRLLNEGFSSRPFLTLVATMLADRERSVGRPEQYPRRWLDVGEEYERLLETGMPKGDIERHLAERFAHSERQIQRIIRMYREAREEHDRLAYD